MRHQDIQIGNYYVLLSSPDYGYIQPIRILKSKQLPNTNNYIVVECRHIVYKTDLGGFIRYFRPRDILAESKNIK